MSYRRKIAFWIAASCLLLALLGTMQFAWIDQISDSRRQSARESLEQSMRLVVMDFRFKIWLLLTAFKADADLDPARRSGHYAQRYYSWHELSLHGPAVERILFFDLTAKGVGTLSELTAGSPGIKPVPWDENLDSVRRYIGRFGFPPGRGVKPRWTSTWFFDPRAMAVVRPMVADIPSSRRRTDWPAVTGYLILKLDLEYILDRLVPEHLDRRFVGNPRSDELYSLTISLDGESLYVYEPSAHAESRRSDSTDGPVGYARRSSKYSGTTGSTRPADRTSPLMLSGNTVPDEVSKRGGNQRIWVIGGAILNPFRNAEFVPDSLLKSADPGFGSPAALLGRTLRHASGLPRLFLAADDRHKLRFEARHMGMSLSEAMDRKYHRSLMMGLVALVLLLAATAMVGITGSRAAHRAELRIAAAASQSHQLLTPVAVVIGLAENMARGVLGRGAKAMEYGTLLRDYGERLHKIVLRSMQMAALASSERRYSLDPVDASSIVRDALEEVESLIKSAGFEAELALGEDLPKVKADPEALRASVGELLNNAVKYGLPGRWLRVETSRTPDAADRQVQIRVHDRGRGIPAGEADRIFEPYYRVPDKLNASIPGSGLGLKLVRDMVKAMGGKLTLESEEGRGSVFTIHLPAAA